MPAKKTQARHTPRTDGTTATALPPAYLRLVEQFRLRPIRTDHELQHAIALIDALLSRKQLHPEEQEYLDVLSDLVEQYEEEAVPMPDVRPGDLLRFLIEQRGVTPQILAKKAGIAFSTLSAVLEGERQLTRQHVHKLAAYFGVEPAVLLPEDS